MKKCIISLIVSICVGFIVIGLRIDLSVVETIYTVSGILFSVGMSLIVTMSTQDVHNLEAKEIIHVQNNKLLKNYILFFVTQTISFVLIILLKDNEKTFVENITCQVKETTISFNCSFSYLLFSMFCIAYYIWNMIATRNQIYKIESKVEEERMSDCQ